MHCIWAHGNKVKTVLKEIECPTENNNNAGKKKEFCFSALCEERRKNVKKNKESLFCAEGKKKRVCKPSQSLVSIDLAGVD